MKITWSKNVGQVTKFTSIAIQGPATQALTNDIHAIALNYKKDMNQVTMGTLHVNTSPNPQPTQPHTIVLITTHLYKECTPSFKAKFSQGNAYRKDCLLAAHPSPLHQNYHKREGTL